MDLGNYIYKIMPVRPEALSEGFTEFESKVMADHYNYLKSLKEKHVLILAGPTRTKKTTGFGIVLINAKTEKEAESIMRKDPAVATHVAKFRLLLHSRSPSLIPPRRSDALTCQRCERSSTTLHWQVPDTVSKLGVRFDAIVSMDSHLDVSLGGDDSVLSRRTSESSWSPDGRPLVLRQISGGLPALRGKKTAAPDVIAVVPEAMLARHAIDVESKAPAVVSGSPGRRRPLILLSHSSPKRWESRRTQARPSH